MGSDARQVRDGGKQFAGVVVFWLVQDLFGVAHFQELPGAHDGDACVHLSDHRQAVGDAASRKESIAFRFTSPLPRRSWCARMASSICAPMRITGFSEVIGS
jgi:hypothetical protein